MRFCHRIEIDKEFKDYVKFAILRLTYLYPKIKFSNEGECIFYQSNEELPTDIENEINYIIYREKIYNDNAQIRKLLMERILGI